jgi:cell division protein ZapA
MNEAAPGSRAAVEVEIAGEKYTLRTDADEEYTRRCAALVDERMRQIGGHGLDRKNAAIMTALSLSDELFRQEARIRDRAGALAGRIEQALEATDDVRAPRELSDD